MRLVPLVGLLAVGFALGAGCSSDSEGEDGAGGSTSDAGDDGGAGGSIAGAGGSGATGGSSAAGGSSGSSATGGSSGGPGTECTVDGDCTAPAVCFGGRCIECHTATCAGHGPYACGDCTDNDGDGLTDMGDPDCLGPCHDKEDLYMGCISGQKNQGCINDCYFDSDSGSGNDGCNWDHRCDPYGTDGSEGDRCPYASSCGTCDLTGDIGACVRACDATPPALPGTCAAMYDTQPAVCESYCGPLTPNGCDCFGCCELPSGSGQYVYLGSTSDNSTQCVNGTCTREAALAGDFTLCKHCTPVAACLNTCETCECCLGKDCNNLPAECQPDTAPPGCVPPQCAPDIQPCGVECTPPCPDQYYCNTGCCQRIPA